MLPRAGGSIRLVPGRPETALLLMRRSAWHSEPVISPLYSGPAAPASGLFHAPDVAQRWLRAGGSIRCHFFLSPPDRPEMTCRSAPGVRAAWASYCEPSATPPQASKGVSSPGVDKRICIPTPTEPADGTIP